MNTNTLIELIQHPEAVSGQQADALEQLVHDFPYFQAARALYLKALKNDNHYAYNQELKTTAAHTKDRSVLFDYITSDIFPKETTRNPFSETKNTPSEIEKAEAILNPTLFERKPASEKKETPEESLQLNQPLSFSKEDTHSFTEWLQLTAAKPIQRENTAKASKPTFKQNETFKRIDKFIRENPKINPKKPTSSENLAKDFTQANEGLMTETLAKVYLQQRNYAKAIQAYKILILKNPEKSGFFADQIRAIKKLQENN